jgi:hypothetical protein
MTLLRLLALFALVSCSHPLDSATTTTTNTTTTASGSGSATDPRPQPPDTLGMQFDGKDCQSDSQCGQGETCFAPDFSPGGGAAPQCQSDTDCTSRGFGGVCGGRNCIPRCTDDAHCGANQVCNPNGHCTVRACNDPRADRCPQNHRCGASGSCERMACTSDSQCDTGVCWNKACYARSGKCAPQGMCCPP